MPLTSQQIRYLRGLTHPLQPVVMIADKGLNKNVISEIESALQHHELVKIKLRADRDTRTAWISKISAQCSAEKVHVIGQVACFFRRNKKKPIIALPGKTR
ncbi:MAG: ribosome assembly RNA-binding protein YhbY [Xanthomonadales bacterium]